MTAFLHENGIITQVLGYIKAEEDTPKGYTFYKGEVVAGQLWDGTKPSDPPENLEEVRKQALAQVDELHSYFLGLLTGNATVEERDTWPLKRLAAPAYLSGTATTAQISMLINEAGEDPAKIQRLAEEIVARDEACHTLIGAAAGLRNKAKAAVAQASTPEEIRNTVAVATQKAEQVAKEWLSKSNV